MSSSQCLHACMYVLTLSYIPFPEHVIDFHYGIWSYFLFLGVDCLVSNGSYVSSLLSEGVES